MLDPYWIQGPDKHTKRTTIRSIFILRNDSTSPPFVEFESENALRILESGQSLGTSRSLSPSRNQPFFNPHLLLSTPERMEQQRNFFEHLLETTRCYLFNSGTASAEDIKKIVLGEQAGD